MKKKQSKDSVVSASEEHITTGAESDAVSLKTFSKFSQKVEDALADMMKEQSEDFLRLDGKINYDRDKAHTRINSVANDLEKTNGDVSFLAYCASGFVVALALVVIVAGVKFMSVQDALDEIVRVNSSEEKRIQFLIEENDALRASVYHMRGELNAADTQIKSLIETYGNNSKGK